MKGSHTHHHEVVPDLFHHVGGGLEHDRKGKCQLQGQEQPHDVVEGASWEVLKDVAWTQTQSDRSTLHTLTPTPTPTQFKITFLVSCIFDNSLGEAYNSFS